MVKCGDAFEIAHRVVLDAPTATTSAMDRDTLYLRTGDGTLAFCRDQQAVIASAVPP